MTLCGWPDVKHQEHTNCHFLVAEYRQKRLAFWVCVASVGNQQRRWEVSVQRPRYHSVRWSIWTNRLPSIPHRPCTSQGHLVSVTNLNKCGLRKFMLVRSVPLRRDASHAGSELGNHSDRKSDCEMLWQKWRLILRRWRLAAHVGGWVTEETVTQTILLLCGIRLPMCNCTYRLPPRVFIGKRFNDINKALTACVNQTQHPACVLALAPFPCSSFCVPWTSSVSIKLYWISVNAGPLGYVNVGNYELPRISPCSCREWDPPRSLITWLPESVL